MIKIWLGPRESDILTMGKYFDKSITFYGSDGQDNYSYCTEHRRNLYYDDNYYKFVFDSFDKLLAMDSECAVHFYSGGHANRLKEMRPEYAQHFKYINDPMLLDWFNNKTYSRTWMENSVDVPRYKLLSKSECAYGALSEKFYGFDEFILQLNHSSGGKGTWKLNKQNEIKLFDEIPGNEPLLVSPYYADTISANCHIIVGENESILFPTSVQIINVQNDKMIYSGGDYTYGRSVDEQMGDKLYDFKSKMAGMLSKTGYRGVCGIDFLVYGEKILLIEINPRYQGSTFVLNHELTNCGYPSITELTTWAFDNPEFLAEWKDRIEKIKIKNEGHVISLSPDATLEDAYRLFDDVKDKHNVFLDGFLNAKEFESSPYLFKYF